MAYYGIPTKALHEQWLGLVQPVGLVVAPAVLTKLELVPNQNTAYISALQLQLKGLLDEVDGRNGEPLKVVPGLRPLLTELLDWRDEDLLDQEALVAGVPEVVLSEYGETLRPTHGVPKLEGEGLQALVLDLTRWRDASGTLTPQWGRDLDAPWNPTGNGWDATPQQRFERLLKETEHPIGLLFNGSQLRLIHAPRGESSGWLTLPLEPMAEVAGRPMLGALELLLGVDRLFGGNPEQRLPAVLAASRKNQNEVSTRLAEQVLEALWELLLGFDGAEQRARERGSTVLGELPGTEQGQKHLYGGLITVLLRLVFLLYAEDEELMPRDSLYGQHYSVSALADRLRQERVEHQSGMTHRVGAWASLLSLFRLVYDGGGADPAYLPARHGELFDPDAYPFLEGRAADSAYDDGILNNLPSLSDDVVEKVLSKLIWLDGERLSYRALDVEQIGSVYEGIMGFTVEQASGASVGITYRPPRQKITITVVVDGEQLLAVSPAKREKWLDEQTGVTLKLPAKVKKDLKDATTLTELCVALDKKLSPHTPNPLAAGSLILQPTAERRRSGSHYTPRALTEPIVAEAFRPWLERCHHQPTAEQVLALKVCDPAMGSGAFLVAVCRYLAGWLVQAWEREGYPEGFKAEWDKDNVARRLIAQRCLYGVDKNPFAVNLAKLSLWLVTLSKELPFTFVDHALKCGDSLVGYSVKEIRAAMSEVQLGFLDAQNRIYEQMGIDRRESFAFDSLSDADYDSKKVLLQKQIEANEGFRQAGDLMVAAFFNAAKPKERSDKQQVYLAMLSGAFEDKGLLNSVQKIRKQLVSGDNKVRPFHWDLEFPEVFSRSNQGFDAIIGNPPFLRGKSISTNFGDLYLGWLSALAPETNASADLVAYFFRKAFALARKEGTLGLISTNTICQGDTRHAGLRYIVNNGGEIFSAQQRKKWPGQAVVAISVLHIIKHSETRLAKFLDGRRVDKITAFLLASGSSEDPCRLAENAGRSYMGSIILGSGFIFSEDPKEGENSLDDLDALISSEARAKEVLFPFIDGVDLNDSPTHHPRRSIISFINTDLAEVSSCYPSTLELIRQRVKPVRDKQKRDSYRKYWWQHAEKQLSLYEASSKMKRIIANTRTGAHLGFAFLPTSYVYAQSLNVFLFDDFAHLAGLQSRIHQTWSGILGSTIVDNPRYMPSDCFETFPFPSPLLKDCREGSEGAMDKSAVEAIGESYYVFRAKLMAANSEGLTDTYNRFHDPAEIGSNLLELRNLHEMMDQAVLAAYGWSDVPTACGFGLDFLDTEEDVQLPDELQERIDSGDLFFWDAAGALDFQGQLQAYGAITGRRKLPWRYRWPDSVRDDVLARLLELNAERYAEEVAMGLHSKGGKQAAKAGGKRRGRPAKSIQGVETEGQEVEQIGLGL